MRYWESEQFNILRKEWYSKLEVNGFEDIEQEDGNLKRWVLNDHLVYSLETFNYYRECGRILYERKFKDPLNEAIWRLHTDGKSVRYIEKAIRQFGYDLKKTAIHDRIKKILNAETGLNA